jgi:enoyl-CoA hydratase/carnithine racemase
MDEPEVLDVFDENIATLTLNTPDRLNALFEAALEMIRPHVGELRRTQDHREGLAALRAKREPQFQGR